MKEIINQKRFQNEVLETVRKHGLSYMDAIIEVCSVHGLEPEDIGRLINGNLKEKLEAEAIKLNMVRGSRSSLEDMMK